MSFLSELKRRNVFRVGSAYLASGWLIFEVLSTVLEVASAPGWVIRVVVAGLFLGFPLVLLFSWAYELTPEGLKTTAEVDASESITHNTGRRLNQVTIVIIALAVLVLVADRSGWIPAVGTSQLTVDAVLEDAAADSFAEAALPDNSIAVLPFVDMSADADQEYFSDGLSEELLNLLAKVPAMQVAARTSSFSFKGQNLEIPEIARRLKVAHVLEGSVRKSGNQIRITAQLVQAADGYHLWSQTYDRQLDDIFAIQDEIAAAVVAELKVALLGAPPQVEVADPEAYALYLQARYLSRLRTTESLEQSIALYQRVLAIAPDYAAAWTGLGDANFQTASAGREEDYAKSREAMEKALSIDGDFAPAHAGLGRIAMTNNDLTQAARHFERALQLDPGNPDIISRAATLMRVLGRLAETESIALYEYLVVRDPVNPAHHYNQAVTFLQAGRWDDAIAAAETALRLSADMINAHYFIGTALLMKRDAVGALEAFSKEGDEEYRVKGEALALYALGRQQEYARKLDELIIRWGDQWPSEVAHVYAFTGEADAAFQWLDRSVEQQEDGLTEQFTQPYYRAVHDDPRWGKFLDRVGSTPEQLDAIEFDITLPR
jgi:TolB-like protein